MSEIKDGGVDGLNEHELPDEYPIYGGYLYVADGKVYRAEFNTIVTHLKATTGFKSLKSCDIAGRNLWSQMV